MSLPTQTRNMSGYVSSRRQTQSVSDVQGSKERRLVYCPAGVYLFMLGQIMCQELFSSWAKAKDPDNPQWVATNLHFLRAVSCRSSTRNHLAGLLPRPCTASTPSPIWAMSLGSSHHTTPGELWRPPDLWILKYYIIYNIISKPKGGLSFGFLELLLTTIKNRCSLQVSLKLIRWRH